MMTLPENVARAADALLDALSETEAFQEYDRLKNAVLSDEVNRRLLERFTRAQTALQMAAVAGSEPREEDTAEFEKLSRLLYDSAEVTDYLQESGYRPGIRRNAVDAAEPNGCSPTATRRLPGFTSMFPV